MYLNKFIFFHEWVSSHLYDLEHTLLVIFSVKNSHSIRRMTSNLKKKFAINMFYKMPCWDCFKRCMISIPIKKFFSSYWSPLRNIQDFRRLLFLYFESLVSVLAITVIILTVIAHFTDYMLLFLVMWLESKLVFLSRDIEYGMFRMYHT